MKVAQKKKKSYQSKLDWDKNNTTQIKAKLNHNTDADIIEHLSKVENIAGYIKDLIRADIAKGEQ